MEVVVEIAVEGPAQAVAESQPFLQLPGVLQIERGNLVLTGTGGNIYMEPSGSAVCQFQSRLRLYDSLQLQFQCQSSSLWIGASRKRSNCSGGYHRYRKYDRRNSQ